MTILLVAERSPIPADARRVTEHLSPEMVEWMQNHARGPRRQVMDAMLRIAAHVLERDGRQLMADPDSLAAYLEGLE